MKDFRVDIVCGKPRRLVSVSSTNELVVNGEVNRLKDIHEVGLKVLVMVCQEAVSMQRNNFQVELDMVNTQG